jgi:F-type H+-transporting ATPase subunit b
MLQIEPSVVVVFIIVWILVVVLTKMVFGPVRRVMRNREEGISSDREAAEQAAQVHEHSLIKIEEDLKQARASAYAVRASLEKDALKEKEKMLAEVSKACREQVESARKDLEEQVERLKAELVQESERLAGEIEERLLP